ncbi:GNAT family N-acetyltransferase [Clostridium sp. MCC353]|nr:GNAT family N-acetyltransferase [Clostridium sp. MCC353]
METKDLILGKAKFEDWETLYRNVWSRPETARYMQWRVTKSEEEARERMHKTISYQKNHDTYLVYDKKTGQAIGFAGVEEMGPQIYQDASIALGPEYVGKGYGKQVLERLLEYCADSLWANEFYYSTRAENTASKALAVSCGFSYRYSEQKTDMRSGETYELEVYSRKLSARK